MIWLPQNLNHIWRMLREMKAEVEVYLIICEREDGD